VQWRRRIVWLRRRLVPWLDRWVRPVVVTLGILAAAAVTAWAVVRVVTLAFAQAERAHDGWKPAAPAAPPPPVSPPSAAETPQEAAEHRRGVWVLILAVGTLLVLVLVAATAQTLVQDKRPADYFQYVGARPMPGANLLQGYHWVDQNAGVVQIPIDRAMDLLAQRGLPARSPADSQVFQDQGQGGPSDSSGGRWP
jgi:hypothetical protein